MNIEEIKVTITEIVIKRSIKEPDINNHKRNRYICEECGKDLSIVQSVVCLNLNCPNIGNAPAMCI